MFVHKYPQFFVYVHKYISVYNNVHMSVKRFTIHAVVSVKEIYSSLRVGPEFNPLLEGKITFVLFIFSINLQAYYFP